VKSADDEKRGGSCRSGTGSIDGIAIWQAGDAYRAHFRRYPVVFLTFKDVKAERWDLAWEAIQRKIGRLVDILDVEAELAWIST